jgi:hypothetical protein
MSGDDDPPWSTELRARDDVLSNPVDMEMWSAAHDRFDEIGQRTFEAAWRGDCDERRRQVDDLAHVATP